MLLFDENQNFVGDIADDIVGAANVTRDTAASAGDIGGLLGVLLFLSSPILGIVYFLLMLIFTVALKLFKFALKMVWWIVRTPFTLVFEREFPAFN